MPSVKSTKEKVTSDNKTLILFAWIIMLMISDLPDIILDTVGSSIPANFFFIKAGFLLLWLVACIVIRRLRPLWEYTLVLLVLFVALGLSGLLSRASWWQNLFKGDEPSFWIGWMEIYIRDFGITLFVIIVLLIIKRRRSEFFLVKGNLDASIEPVKWLGIKKGESWRTFGWIFAFAAGLLVLIPIFLSIKPGGDLLVKALPLLPAVLIFAAINAFNEEVYFRASILSTLYKVIGKKHTLLITIVFFGLSHYLYGSPPGFIGFAMTGFLAWLLGKSMLETKGFVWAWFIHFVPDAVIFFSYAVDWVK